MIKTRRAVTEFLVIVVGVFIALAAERWSAGRADRALIDDYVGDLVSDLQDDSVHLDDQVRATVARIGALSQLLGDLNRLSPLGAEGELIALTAAQSVPEPLGASATYRDLTSTGNLRLLDPGLRRAVVEYDTQLQRAQGVVQRNGGEKPPFGDLIPGRVRTGISLSCRREPVAITSECREELSIQLASMSIPERDALSSWREMPGIRRQFERGMQMSVRYQTAVEEVRRVQERALAQARGPQMR